MPFPWQCQPWIQNGNFDHISLGTKSHYFKIPHSGPQAAAGLGPLTEVSGNLLWESLPLTSLVI